MKSKILIISLLLSSLFWISCSSCCKTTAKIDNVFLEDAKALNIQLVKSECFGKCEAYVAEIKDGEMKLNAINNLPKLGEYTIALRDYEIKSLYANATKYKIFEDLSEESHHDGATDLPFCKMTLMLNGDEKVINYRGLPVKSIEAIDDAISAIIKDTSRYVSVKN